jgi:hypothetical protein
MEWFSGQWDQTAMYHVLSEWPRCAADFQYSATKFSGTYLKDVAVPLRNPSLSISYLPPLTGNR